MLEKIRNQWENGDGEQNQKAPWKIRLNFIFGFQCLSIPSSEGGEVSLVYMYTKRKKKNYVPQKTEGKHSTYKNKGGVCGVCTSVKNVKFFLRENCEV